MQLRQELDRRMGVRGARCPQPLAGLGDVEIARQCSIYERVELCIAKGAPPVLQVDCRRRRRCCYGIAPVWWQ
jgi:hypothetical protein